jgi:hypothetical protein
MGCVQRDAGSYLIWPKYVDVANPVEKNLITGTDQGGIALISQNGKEAKVKIMIGLSRQKIEILYTKSVRRKCLEMKRDGISEGELRIEDDHYFFKGDRTALSRMLLMCEAVLNAKDQYVDVEEFIK